MTNTTVTATLSSNSYTLSAATAGTGSGTISGCAGNLAGGASYSCTVTANSGSNLASLSGCGGSLSGNTYSGTMPSSNCTVTATLNLNPTLSLATSGTGNGTVSGTNCATNNYASGTLVTCSATPNSGSSFAGWTGSGNASGCSGTGSCSFTLSSNSTLTATFNAITYSLWTATAGTGSGTISGCAGNLAGGASYSCTVTANSGSNLASMSGCGGSLSGNTFSGTMPSSNCTVTATVNLNLEIVNTNLPNGEVNTAYNVSLSATGGTSPYSWSVASGALPVGVSLNSSTGTLSGTPPSAGSFNVTLGVQDAKGDSATSNFSLTIIAALTITTATLPSGTDGIAYAATLTATGGTPGYTWSIPSGQLPPGLTLAATTGVISGTPTATGTYNFTFAVTDNGKPPQTQAQFTSTQVAAAGTGPRMQSGTGAPANAIGNNGDLYHRTDVPQLYGPKANGVWPSTYSVILGKGCTTAYHIDADCDGYGVGTDPNDPDPLFGPDADDTDATVNTRATVLSKYGTITSFLSTVKGYSPLHIWYWDGSAGNDSTCVANDETKPCLTWAKVQAVMVGGDAVLMRSGAINLSNAYGLTPAIPSGTSSHSTILMSYPGELGSLVVTSATPMSVVTFSGKSYLIMDGFKASNVTSGDGNGGGLVGSGGSQTSYVIIRNVEETNSYDGIWWNSTTDHCIIENNLVYKNLGEHNIYMGTNAGSGGDDVGLIVRGNIFHDAGRDNFHSNGSCDSCVLDGNIMYSANMDVSGAGNITFQNGVTSSTISNNVVFNSSAWSFLMNNYDNAFIPTKAMNYNLIVNNTFIRTGRDATGDNLQGNYAAILVGNNSQVVCGGLTGGTLATAGTACDMGHNTYANNALISGSAYATDVLVAYTVNSQIPTVNYLATDSWTNNIIYNPTSGGGNPLETGYVTIASGLFTYSPQTWSFFQSNAGVFSNNSQANPQLAAWNTAWYNAPQDFDLHLQSGSPAIGAGTATSAPSTDIQGNARTTPPSVGAYQ